MNQNCCATVQKIGRMNIFSAERLGTGRFGTVFPGKIKDVVEEIVIKRMKKDNIQVDSSHYVKTNGQSNIIEYYGIDESDPTFT